jgi:serine/threonine protein kinase/Tol biopolymer transport system component
MALAVGDRIAHYEVVATIGSGGMGVVYRAHDRKLGRDVALKVLPDDVAGDPERLARFEREAQVLAALNHPNIAGIYGLEVGEPPAGSVHPVRALVLELVEGPTLDALLHGVRTAAVPVKQALTIASQIAAALEAAHDAGIVHRDLKPANVKVREDGTVKVLDFGLAKAMGAPVASGTDPDLANSPTVTSPALTERGVILGTAAYMSPEQARGRTVDKRADVWAFGCVLFEMLTRRRPFDGESVTETLARVLEREPDWAALAVDTPPNIRTLLRRCLEKDPKRRLRDIGDAGLEIEEVLSGKSPVSEPTSAVASVPVAAAPPPLGRFAVPIAAVVLLLVVGFMLTRRPSPPAADGSSAGAPVASLSAPIRLTSDPGLLQTDPAVKADGSMFVYAAAASDNFDLYVRSATGGNAVPITNDPAHDWQPDWSVDDQIVFRSERAGGGLYVVPHLGGREQRVAGFGFRPRWSPDGRLVLFRDKLGADGHLHVVGTDGADPRLLSMPNIGAFGWGWDSTRVARLYTEPGPQFTPHLVGGSLEGGSEPREWAIASEVAFNFRELALSVRGLEPFVWSADGRSIYFIGSVRSVLGVWRLDVDPGTESVTGGPHRLTSMTESASGLALARKGSVLVFGASTGNTRVWLKPLDAAGRRLVGQGRAVTPDTQDAPGPALDSTASTVTYTSSRPGANSGLELHLLNLRANDDRVLRVDDSTRGEIRSQPKISPDGRRIVYRYVASESEGAGRGGGAGGRQRLRMYDVATGTETWVTSEADGVELPGSWTADGRFLVVTAARRRYAGPGDAPPGLDIAIYAMGAAPRAESQRRVVTSIATVGIWQPSISADGRWIAFNRTAPSRPSQLAVVGSQDGAWLAPVPESEWILVGNPDDGVDRDKPRWSPDGRILYYVARTSELADVWGVDFDPASGRVGEPFQVTSFSGPGEQMSGFGGDEISVANGQLAVPVRQPTGGIWALEVR